MFNDGLEMRGLRDDYATLWFEVRKTDISLF